MLEKSIIANVTEVTCIGRMPNETESAALQEVFGTQTRFQSNDNDYSNREAELVQMASTQRTGSAFCLFSTNCSHAAAALMGQSNIPFILLQHGIDGELLSIQQFSQKRRSVPWVKESLQAMTA